MSAMGKMRSAGSPSRHGACLTVSAEPANMAELFLRGMGRGELLHVSNPVSQRLTFVKPHNEVCRERGTSEFTQASRVLSTVIVTVHSGLHQGMAHRDLRGRLEPKNLNRL